MEKDISFTYNSEESIISQCDTEFRNGNAYKSVSIISSSVVSDYRTTTGSSKRKSCKGYETDHCHCAIY